MDEKKHVKFGGRLVFVGFGSIGQGTLPLILRHVDMRRDRITILTADDRGRKEAEEYGVKFVINPLKRDNYQKILESLLGRGDFLLNLSVDVSSAALIEFCLQRGVFYLDTCIEPWHGMYTDASLPPSQRSNYGLREEVLELKRKYPKGASVVPTHGANPGLISHWVKQGMLNVARDVWGDVKIPKSREEWGGLAKKLGIKAIHCAERDTQVAEPRKRQNEFANTWSVDGFVSEGRQPSELGWGTHEKHFPPDGHRHDYGCRAAIYLDRPGMSVKVRSWTPDEGPFHGFLITHGEAISIADYFTLRENGSAIYRPTCHYAYHPCDDAVLSNHEMGGKNWIAQPNYRIFMDEIFEGVDELGALLMGHPKNAYWFGSRLSIQQARELAPFNNATSLQVVAGVLGGLVWILENPEAGLVDPDDLDYRRVLDVADPYLGDIVGAYSDWTPLNNRGWLFEEDIDKSDPWQFKNIRVL
ncbi:MAG: saccharopine dehydrogenase NADP-binding domain-containing protein [Betaproteobacteria bacterium]|nr:saccharopine dehydrogenase NADP-binding domain-containing protein [Betaproteobacteria bacterium]MDH3435914.1 saccharopine dehydrogenase NADP-binding domain-containing protein [Betaproteobacteria bacterium]